jgi:hypothetical protein
MRKILDENYPRHIDPVTTLTIDCLDRRIKGSRGRLGEHLGYAKSLPLVIPGGVKDLVYPKHSRDRERILEWVGLFGGDLAQIIAKAHNDCKACAHCKDLNFYDDMLQKAAKILRESFPRVEIIPIFVNFDGFYLVEMERVMSEVYVG